LKDQKTPAKHQKKINRAFGTAGPYMSISYFFMAGIGLFGFIGYRVDLSYNTKPIFVLVGMFAGLALGFYNMMKVLSQLKDKD